MYGREPEGVIIVEACYLERSAYFLSVMTLDFFHHVLHVLASSARSDLNVSCKLLWRNQ
jgi:hypothetical protein